MKFRFSSILFAFTLFFFNSGAQLTWKNVDSLYLPLPSSVHVYFTDQAIDSSPFRAFYLVADLHDKKLEFTSDTSRDRRLTPSQFFQRNDQALAVVNCTFFSFETNRSLNTVIKNGKLVSYNNRRVKGIGADSIKFSYPNLGTFGIDKKRRADIAWTKTDSTSKYALANEDWPYTIKEYRSNRMTGETQVLDKYSFFRWEMQTAVGGGPVLLQKGNIQITNEEEKMFAGKAIKDKHPRTAMGYTQDGKLIILVIEGRNKMAGGATLTQEAQIFKDLGCWEALNLDGGGSSCLLVNGKETIKISDATGQRPVPAVFMIQLKK
jgi:exopolysaccharide biosynthesis protein